MKPNSDEIHSKNLEYVINHLNEIGEDMIDVKWIIKEGIWVQEYSARYNPMCDLILVNYGDYASLVELKNSRKYRNKAIRQLESSEEFVKDCLVMPVFSKKIVYYGNGLSYEVL